MTYQPRALRVAAAFPLTYVNDGGSDASVEGNCLNVSESGLLGDFTQALELWTRGELLLHFGGDALGLKVRVARVSGTQAGVVFIYDNTAQRQTIIEVVTAAALEMTQKGHCVSVPF